MTMRNKVKGSRRSDLGPNVGLIGKPKSRQALATPALILDLGAFEHNVKTMARLCKQAGVALRPHAKTHKSVEVARRQIAAGAVGISVATVREAAVLVEAGLPGVLLTTPVVGDIKLDIVLGLAKRSKDFMVVVDTLAGVEALERGGRKLTVLVDIDIGMTRTGSARCCRGVETHPPRAIVEGIEAGRGAGLFRHGSAHYAAV